MISQNLDYAIPCFNYANSLSYIANKIGSLKLPVIVGQVNFTSIAICTVGEWGIRLQHISRNRFRLDVVSFPKEVIKRILAIDSDASNDRFKTFMRYFSWAAEFCDTDINTIPFLEELYYDFPIREMFRMLNESCDHKLDVLDTDSRRPNGIVITASARQFLSGRK